MLNIGRGWLVPVTMLNIRRGRRREHPMDISTGVTWPSVTTGVAQLPVAHAHTQGNPEGGQVIFGSHVTTTKKKAREKAGHTQNLLPVRATSGQGLFRSRDFVTSCQKAPLGRIWHNFRRGTWLMSLPVTWLTSLPVMSLPVMRNGPVHHTIHLKCGLSSTHILLIGTDWTGRCKSNYHTITTNTVPFL